MARSGVEVDVRVVLVGKTGLDASLRLDEGIELARVSTPHEAVGELASPMAGSPSATCVIVSPETEQGLLGQANGANGAIPGRDRLVEFIRALRLVDPAVRVLGVEARERSASALPTRDLYDAIVDPEHPAESMRAAMPAVADSPPARAEDGVAPAPPGVVAPDQSASRAQSGLEPPPPRAEIPLSGAGDQALVELAIRGHDILPAALDLLRQRTSDPSLQFVPPSSGEGSPQGVPVVWGDVVYGSITGSAHPALHEHAAWLATWLRLRDQQDQLRHAAFTDPLTGAWNRRYLDRFLTGAIDSARLNRWSVTVLMFDIDNFKRYNDEYGHEAGDEILVEIVRLLRSVTRPTDKVCRIGGDEFAVLFHEPEGPRSPDSRHPQSVSDIAQRFQSQILGHRFPKLSGCAPGTLTISGGLATFPWDGNTPAELLVRADERAMESKRQGKNAITIGPGAVLCPVK